MLKKALLISIFSVPYTTNYEFKGDHLNPLEVGVKDTKNRPNSYISTSPLEIDTTPKEIVVTTPIQQEEGILKINISEQTENVGSPYKITPDYVLPTEKDLTDPDLLEKRLTQ